MADTAQFFVDLPVSQDANSIVDNAITSLESQIPGWEPNDGNLEVMILEEVGPMAADVAQQAAQLPSAALRAYGTKLLGVPYDAGAQATTTVTFTMADSAGYTVQTGCTLEIDGYAFQLPDDLVVPSGSTSGTATVQAVDPASASNGLTGVTVAPLLMPQYVADMVVDAPTSGGDDPETDEDYQGKISLELRQRAKTIVNATDYEIEALTFSGIGRAYCVGNTAREVTVYVTDPSGEPVASGVKASLLADLQQYAMVNVEPTITINDPAYTTVAVTWEATAWPGFDSAALVSAVDAMLTALLSPLGWAQAPGTTSNGDPATGWASDPVVAANFILGQIAGVVGIQTVTSVELSASNIAELGGAGLPLSTGGAITSLPVAALQNAIPSGAIITLTDPIDAHSQAWTVSAAAAIGATTVSVASQVPNYAYPTASVLSGPVSGDLTMLGSVALPNPGTLTGTIA